MINETVILLARLEDCSNHSLAKHFGGHLIIKPDHDINFYKPLQKIFSKVIPYDFTQRTTEIGLKGINEEVIELVRKEHPKYVLWLSVSYELQESTFDAIRKEGSKAVGWFFDDEFRFDDYSKWWIPHLDYCVTFDIEAVPKYKSMGARVIQVISCEGIPVDRDWSTIKEKYDVSFVGSKTRKPLREQYINELRNKNIPVHLFGTGWGSPVPWEGRLPFEEMIDIFGTSKINLNFSGATRSNRMGAKGRITEVCLSGGFLLTEYAPGIENYFEIDKEIVCFSNTQEMIDKVIYYLNHDEERRAIAQAGWKRAVNEYTPFHMLSRVFGEIEKDTTTNDREDNPHPQELRMPRQIRNNFSDYYLDWGMAFSVENYKGLWKDALALAMSYNPFNTRAWYHYIIGFFPYSMRLVLIRLYRALYFRLST